jgi:hypothetical protein
LTNRLRPGVLKVTMIVQSKCCCDALRKEAG